MKRNFSLKLLCLVLAAVSLLTVLPLSAASRNEIVFNYDDLEVIDADSPRLSWDSVKGADYYEIIIKVLKGQPDYGNSNESAAVSYEMLITNRKIDLERYLEPGKYLKIWVCARDYLYNKICGKSLYLRCAGKAGDKKVNPYTVCQNIPMVTIPDGSVSSLVGWVQCSLNLIMDAGLDIDNSNGPKTRNAVKQFQKKYGLSADGSCGPKTLAKLMSVLEEQYGCTPFKFGNTVNENCFVFQQNDSYEQDTSEGKDVNYFGTLKTNGSDKVSASGCGPMALFNAINYMNGGNYYTVETGRPLVADIVKKSGCNNSGVNVSTMLTKCQDGKYEYVGTCKDSDLANLFSNGAHVIAIAGISNKTLRKDYNGNGAHIIAFVGTRINANGKTEVYVLDSFNHVTSTGTHRFSDANNYNAGYWVELNELTGGFDTAYVIQLPGGAMFSSGTSHSLKP